MPIDPAPPVAPEVMTRNEAGLVTIRAIKHDCDASRREAAAAERQRPNRAVVFLSALLQYSSADRAFSSNLRFRWEYRPGSELFIVYTDEHDTTDPYLATATTIHGLKNRAFVVKVNRLWRY